MLILQVLNNNVLLVEDEQGQERIVWGRGIGFHAKKGLGYQVQPEDKIFSEVPADDEQWVDSFKELSSKIPHEYFELTEKIIQLARAQVDTEFDQHMLIPLTDHIFFAVERFKMNLDLNNPMLFDLQRFFTQEYAVGQQAQQMIHDFSGVPISDDEAGFIAIHLVEHEITQSTSRISNFSNFLEITTEVNDIIQTSFGKSFSGDDVSMNRLMTHIHFLIIRANSHSEKTSSPEDTELLHRLMFHHAKATWCMKRIVKYLSAKIDYRFSDGDKLYLLIHLIHITE
ncbi:PRD domain-containing protein [Lactobacillus selangorensis]|uniref:PRD domain-containing protein n=1 Tax=Lactobacillus selangorensis TaxID=81857 RepID=UPI000A3E192F|nr:PRD domain-containing protein [Lactobacillus selangorensis]